MRFYRLYQDWRSARRSYRLNVSTAHAATATFCGAAMTCGLQVAFAAHPFACALYGSALAVAVLLEL